MSPEAGAQGESSVQGSVPAPRTRNPKPHSYTPKHLAGDRSLELARRGVEQANASTLRWPRIMQGALAARVLRMAGDAQHRDEREARITETIDLIRQCDMVGILPLVLLERAGLLRMRGDTDGMACDLTEARRLFAQMGATGWDDYATSIEA